MKLDWKLISASLGVSANKIRHHAVIDQIASTNDWRSWAAENQQLPAVCVAEMQTAGRGRRSRAWLSPASENIYLSLVWSFNDVTPGLPGLSLAVGVALARIIEPYCADVKLKWPNDILIKGKKLGGVLIEARLSAAGDVVVIIGVGLNFHLEERAHAELDGMACDLVSCCGQSVLPERNQFVAKIIDALMCCCEQYAKSGFSAFYKDWERYDICLGNFVEVQDATGDWSGIARGLDSQFGLIVQQHDSERVVYAADVSVRVAYVDD